MYCRMESKECGSVTVIRIGERLGLTLRMIDDSVAMHESPQRIVLNFENVIEDITGPSLRQLLALNRKIHGCGGQLILCGIPPHIGDVFRVCKFQALFCIFEEECAALQNLRRVATPLAIPLISR